MHLLALLRDRAQEFSGGPGDPAPHDAGQLVIGRAQPLRFALGYVGGGGAVSADQKQRSFPNLALVGHHRDHRDHNAGGGERVS